MHHQNLRTNRYNRLKRKKPRIAGPYTDIQLSINYDPEKNILYGRYKGTFTITQFEAQLQRIVSASEFPPDVPAIWDLSETNMAQFDWEFIEQLLEIRARFPARGDALIAIVAPSDLTFGVSRMYAARGTALPQQVEVFRDVPAAEDWRLNQRS